jgi:hypothetical protein
MADDDKVVKADFTKKRRPPGNKPNPKPRPQPALLQSKRFGIVVLVLIVAFGFAAHLYLTAP